MKTGVFFSEDIIFPLKQNTKTCNLGLNLPSKTCFIWIYNIPLNTRSVAHYSVRKTYDIILPVSPTYISLPWELHTGCTILPQKLHPLLFTKTLLNLQTVQAPLFRQLPTSISPLYTAYVFFVTLPPPTTPHPLKIGFFGEPQYFFLHHLTPHFF